MQAFAKVYPCKICATGFQQKIKEHPPKLDNRLDFVVWMCEQHNMVNKKLGKPEFKCNMRRIELMHGLPQRKSWDSI